MFDSYNHVCAARSKRAFVKVLDFLYKNWTHACLKVLAPLHAKLDVIRVDTAILGERNAEFVLVLGDGELARNVLVDFNGDADAFNARVVDGRLVRGGLAVEVDVGLEADVDVARSVAEVDRGDLGRNVVFDRRGNVVVGDQVLHREVQLDRGAVGALGVAVDLGALLGEGDGDVAELLVVGGDAQGAGLALFRFVNNVQRVRFDSSVIHSIPNQNSFIRESQSARL